MRKEVEDLFFKCKSLAGTDKTEEMDEYSTKLKEIATPEEMAEVGKLMDEWLEEIRQDIEDIKAQWSEEREVGK
ncbi:MAG: hypothetical protein ACI3ZD_15985 [Prevotella sp.]